MAEEKYLLGKLLWLSVCVTRRIPEDRAQQEWRDWEDGEGYFMTKGEWQQAAEVFKAAAIGADALAAIEAAGGIASVPAVVRQGPPRMWKTPAEIAEDARARAAHEAFDGVVACAHSWTSCNSGVYVCANCGAQKMPGSQQ